MKVTKKPETHENQQVSEVFKPKKSFPCPSDPKSRDKTASGTAKLVALSTVAATRVIVAAEGKSGFGEILDIPALIGLLREQASAVALSNDLAEVEAMLMNQAVALQSLFVRLVERGMSCESIPGFEVNLRMALRAQAQSRAALEALAEAKSPRALFVRQQNIAHGPQQVNNGIGTRTETQNPPNELTGGCNELLPDNRASQAAGRIDTQVETVGEIDRAEVGRG